MNESSTSFTSLSSFVEERIFRISFYLRRLSLFLISVHTSYRDTRLKKSIESLKENKKESETKSKVLVIGGGPAGLLTAIISQFHGGISIQGIVEKRHTHTRSIWFDLYPNYLSHTQTILFHFLGARYCYLKIEVQKNQKTQQIDGRSHQPEENYSYDGTDVVSIECSVLEKFLLKIVFLFKVPFLLEYEYLHSCYYPTHKNDDLQNNQPQLCENGVSEFLLQNRNHDLRPFAVIRDNHIYYSKRDRNDVEVSKDKNNHIFIEYDILIGADGSKSNVRSSNPLFSFRSLSSFSLLPHSLSSSPTTTTTTTNNSKRKDVNKNSISESSVLNIDDLRQTAIFLNFKRNSKGKCPEPKTTSEGRHVDPWEVGFCLSELGIHSVFKRFYHSHCQIQILMTHQKGEEVYEKFRLYSKNNVQTSLDNLPVSDRSLLEYTKNYINIDSKSPLSYSPSTLTAELEQNLEEYRNNILSLFGKNTNEKYIEKIESNEGETQEEGETKKKEQDAEWQEKSIPWNVLLSVVNEILEHKIETIKDLKQLLVSRQHLSQNTQNEIIRKRVYDIKVLQLKLFLSDNLYQCYPLHCEQFFESNTIKPLHSDISEQSQVARTGVMILLGDSVRSAYFRLGIGVNNIFNSLDSLDQFFWYVEQYQSNQLYLSHNSQTTVGNNPLLEYLQSYQIQEKKRNEEIVSAQLRTMFYESYCGLVVGFEDPKIPFTSPILWKKVPSYQRSPNTPSCTSSSKSFEYSRVTSLEDLLSLEFT